jgi:hypothetical protein
VTFTPWTPVTTGINPLLPAVGISIATLPGIWAADSGSTVPAQELLVTLATATQTVSLTKMATWIGGAGVTAGAGINGLAIYTEAGLLLGQTVDMTAAFQVASSYAQANLTANVPVTAGTNYYLCYLHNFTGTVPTIPGFIPPPGTTPVINGHILHGFLASQASFPASFSPGGLSAGQHWFWVTGSV